MLEVGRPGAGRAQLPTTHFLLPEGRVREGELGWTEGFEPSISRATTWRLRPLGDAHHLPIEKPRAKRGRNGSLAWRLEGGQGSDRYEASAVRLYGKPRPQPDGGGVAAPPGRRPVGGAQRGYGAEGAGRADRRGDAGDRDRHQRPAFEARGRVRRPAVRLRDHGLR